MRPNPHENLLRDVLGLVTAAGHARRHRHDAREVPLDEGACCMVIAGRDSSDEGSVRIGTGETALALFVR
jgi:hypothetical protein